MNKNRNIAGTLALAVLASALACAGAAENKSEPAPALKTPRLLATLPDACNTPDGMCLLPDKSIIVSAPNYNDVKQAPLLIKVTADNKAEVFYNFPTPYPGVPAGTERIGPMGIAFDPSSGNLYLADNQGKDQNSRLWKLVLKDGKVDKMVLVARGFNIANGVAVSGGFVYITESVLEQESRPLVSAVMRFKLDEENVQLATPLNRDKHIVATFKSQKDQWRFGADGITFDKKGNLYVGLFGEAIMYKVTFDKSGKMKSCNKFAEAPDRMISCDGMCYDKQTDRIYMADCAGNAVQVISMDGKVETLSRNDDVPDVSAKKSGWLDEPSEVLVRGKEIIAANMDWPLEGFVNKAPYRLPATLSVINLK